MRTTVMHACFTEIPTLDWGWHQLGLCVEWEPEVGSFTQLRSLKAAWGHTNDCVWMTVKIDAAAKRRAVSSEAPLPAREAEQGHCMGVAILARQESAAESGAHVQQRKVVGRHQFAPCPFAYTAGARIQNKGCMDRNIFQSAGIAEIQIIRVGE